MTDTLIVVLLNGEAVATCTDDTDLAECLRIPKRNPRTVITLIRRSSAVATAMVEANTAAFMARIAAEKRAISTASNEAWTWGGHTVLAVHYAKMARMFPALY
jgi:hypothetical protein